MRFWFVVIIYSLSYFGAMAKKSCYDFEKAEIMFGRKDGFVTLKKPQSKSDTRKFPKPDSIHSPRKAVTRSIMIPGWGQVYNHRIWKVPIIYGGFAALGLAIQYNLHYYNLYLHEAQARQTNSVRNPDFASIPGNEQQFFSAAQSNQRNFQLSILGIVGLWGINCIDAYTDAKFRHSYTVDNDLSFKVVPTFITPPLYAANSSGFVPGVKLTFTLK